MVATIRPLDQLIARRVINTMLLLRAQPPQLRREFGDILSCHRHLVALGFRLVEKRENYGGPRLESGRPMSPILLWRNERVIVRIKPRGEPAAARHRQGLAHMSVCLVSGNRDSAGRMDTGWSAEVGKFSHLGHLLEKGPGAAIAAAPAPLAKSAGETWSDQTHFLFPDLVCDDAGVGGLIPFTT